MGNKSRSDLSPRFDKKAYADRIRAERTAAGVCTNCGSPDLRTKRRCGPCADRRLESQRARQAQAVAAGVPFGAHQKWSASGLCARCGGPRDTGYKTCTVCRRDNRLSWSLHGAVRIAERVTAGICTVCAGPVADGSRYCEAHKAKAAAHSVQAGRDSRKRREIDGRCNCCAAPKLPTVDHCAYHHVYRLLYVYLRRAPTREEVDAVVARFTGRCAYTDLPITMGGIGEMEHIYPRLHFPALAGEITNIVWAHTRINHAKDDMDPTSPELVNFLPEAAVLRIWDLASKVVGRPMPP